MRWVARAPSLPGTRGVSRVVNDLDLEVRVQAAKGRHDQAALRARADEDGVVTAARPAQHRMERAGGGLREHPALIADAIRRDEHVLVNEETFAPAASRACARADRRARAQSAGPVAVFAQMRVSRSAAAAFRKALVHAPKRRFDKDAMAFLCPPCGGGA